MARIGVVGAGMMGTIHVRLLGGQVHGAAVAAVGDLDQARAGALAQADAGGARVHGDPFGVVRDPDVDAVIVASSDASHEALVLACLEAGKPVLCEKPLAATAEGGLRIVEAEAALGRRLVTVGYMRRFDAGYAALKEAVDGGALGAPLLVHCVHRNADVPPDYTSDMLVMNTGVHEIDIVRWLLGEEIAAATVLAPRSSRRARGKRDPQLMLLETESGVVVDVEVFVSAQYGYDIRCEVVGEAGTASLAPPQAIAVRRAGHDGATVPAGFGDRFEDAYRRELQAWVAGLAAGEAVGASAWDGYAASAVAEASLAALESGERRAIRLAARPELYAAGAVPVSA
jgi:myo-inositol 2-dehydrogenase/D-chiro-inositol 1-dehydrogenase